MPKPKILVVDDQPYILDLLSDFLFKEGYQVVLAESGEKAAEVVKTTGIQLALIDLKLTGMDGIATMKKINQTDPDILTIIITGYPTQEFSVQALKAGAYDYVTKPFRLEELKKTIDRALKEYQLRQEISQLRDKIKKMEEELRTTQNKNSKVLN
ncbi:MAG: hypothetical protein A2145_05115 [candidate division Zixibacteria bacterium RBG_16_40_9]|nr:MAG: hypothetical protein A2145_05115 [candidate division Zixibacteria bacterium RBG_16_40_9]